MPDVLSIDDALRDGAPVIHDNPDAHVKIPVRYEPERNLAAYVSMDVGYLEQGLAEAEAAVDHAYVAHYAQHCPIEPHVAFTYIDPEGRLVISTQVPFHVRRIVAQCIEMPIRQFGSSSRASAADSA